MCFLPKNLLKKLSTLSAKGVLIACSLFTPIALAVCNSSVPAITPSSDFIVHNDGTVTHKPTGLMWKVCSEGQTWATGTCTGAITTHTWDVALQISETLNSSGGFPLNGVGTPYTDWRLPNLKELQSIVELQCYGSAINATIFPNGDSDGYWSSTPDVSHSDNAWGVSFYSGNGRHNSRNDLDRVRLVRGGL